MKFSASFFDPKTYAMIKFSIEPLYITISSDSEVEKMRKRFNEILDFFEPKEYTMEESDEIY